MAGIVHSHLAVGHRDGAVFEERRESLLAGVVLADLVEDAVEVGRVGTLRPFDGISIDVDGDELDGELLLVVGWRVVV